MAGTTATAAPIDIEAGKFDKRLEAAITTGMDAAITERAKLLAGGKDPKMFRSRAARDLLVKGIRAAQAEEARRSAKA